jgi:hypothetical protein
MENLSGVVEKVHSKLQRIEKQIGGRNLCFNFKIQLGESTLVTIFKTNFQQQIYLDSAT